jgi:hypothetical protein
MYEAIDLPADEPLAQGESPSKTFSQGLNQLLGGFGPERSGILAHRIKNACASCMGLFLELLRRWKVSFSSKRNSMALAGTVDLLLV